MFLDASTMQPRSRGRYDGAINQSVWLNGVAINEREPGDSQPKPCCQRRECERQHETVIEPISQDKVKKGREQEINIPVVLEKVKAILCICEFERKYQRGQVQDVI